MQVQPGGEGTQRHRPVAELEPPAVERVFRELQSEGAELLTGEGVADDDHYFAWSADMRYVGQEYTVSVAINGGGVDLGAIDSAFHEAHRIRYGHSTPGAPVEFVNLRLAAFGRIADGIAPFKAPSGALEPRAGTRHAIFDGESHETPLLYRDALAPGARLEGPVVIGEQGSTTVIPPGYRGAVDEHGNLVIASAR